MSELSVGQTRFLAYVLLNGRLHLSLLFARPLCLYVEPTWSRKYTRPANHV